MPTHDWSRVSAGTFHDFHGGWIVELRNALNGGILPAGYYAMAEQVAQDEDPDVLALEAVPVMGDGTTQAPSAGSATASAQTDLYRVRRRT